MPSRAKDRPITRLIVLLAVVVLVAAACGEDAEGAGPEPGRRTQTTGPSGDFPEVDEPVSTPPGDATTTTTASSTTTTPPLADIDLALDPVVELDSPTALVTRAGSDRFYAAERDGRVLALDRNPDGTATPRDEPVLDLSDRTTVGSERGLLSIVFSPDGDELFVSFTNPEGDTRVEAYPMRGERAVVDRRRRVLAVDQPFSNHNGGHLVFDNDGALWFGLGDGGASDDPDNRAQDPDRLLGSMLRLDPAGAAEPEVVVIGVRNPWRFSFDTRTGELWIADVGQNTTEEIDRLAAEVEVGTNLGWSGYEGSSVYQPDRVPEQSTPPIFEMSHEDGWCSVTGGYVYRGDAIPALEGAYLFGDYCMTDIHALRTGDGVVTEEATLGIQVPSLVSFARDEAGELYTLSLDGAVARIVPA